MEIKIKEKLISEEEIQKRVKELADLLNKDFRGSNPVIIGVLNGSFVFTADLVRNLNFPAEVQFIKASSYHDATVSSGKISIDNINLDIKDREVILVEDIVDTGRTLKKLKDLFEQSGAKSVSTISLLNKPSRRAVDIDADYTGFEIEDKFVVGYGLDYAQLGRNLPYIGVLEENEEENG